MKSLCSLHFFGSGLMPATSRRLAVPESYVNLCFRYVDSKVLTIKIEKGWKAGMKLRFRGSSGAFFNLAVCQSEYSFEGGHPVFRPAVLGSCEAPRNFSNQVKATSWRPTLPGTRSPGTFCSP